jgi:hypothetical protein
MLKWMKILETKHKQPSQQTSYAGPATLLSLFECSAGHAELQITGFSEPGYYPENLFYLFNPKTKTQRKTSEKTKIPTETDKNRQMLK